MRIAKIAAIAAAAMTAFQACADVRSAAFSKKKSAEPISTKPVEDPVGTKPVEEEDLPICDDPAATDTALPGAGTTDDPFVLCRPAHLRLIGNTATNPDYALDKHYILGKDIALIDNESSPIGGPCGAANAFTGSFDGREKTISNIGFTSAAKDIYVKNLFSCSDKVENTKYSYALSDEDVCLEVDNTMLITREDHSGGPYIVCSRAHLNAIDAAEPGLLTDSYALYQDINLGTTAEGGDNGRNFTPIAGSFTGTFDGRGKKIMNLTISISVGSDVISLAGLFLKLGAGGVIQDLGIKNFNVAVTASIAVTVGSLVAEANGRIVNCYAVDSDENADVLGLATTNTRLKNIGGLVGFQERGSIISSYVRETTVDGSGGNDNVGGLVGFQQSGSIISSYVRETAIDGDGGGDNVGGLVGDQLSGGSIISSYVRGTTVDGVGGGDSVGGLAGGSSGSIIFSYVRGTAVDGSGGGDFVGGLVGLLKSVSLIISSYAAGEVDGGEGSDFVGGLVGRRNAGSVIASYGFGAATGETTNTLGAPPAGGVNALTAATAGSQWGGGNSPWKFGTSSQPPALAFITGATTSESAADPPVVTVAYSCASPPPTTAFLPAISITCGTTLLPGQR